MLFVGNWTEQVLTWKFLVDSAIFRQEAVELSVCGDHASFDKVRVQAQAADGSEQTSD